MDKETQKLVDAAVNIFFEDRNPFVLNERDYIGSISHGDVVNGEAVYDFMERGHDETVHPAMERWKYSTKYNTVVWSSDYDETAVELVNAWLAKRGVKAPKHESYTTFYVKHPDLMDLEENDLPIGGEEKYNKQEPGGEMMAVNISEDYIGSVHNDAVRASLVQNAYNHNHKHLGDRWRYDLKRNLVIWADIPPEESIVVLNQWLEKRGVKAPKHQDYYGRPLADGNKLLHELQNTIYAIDEESFRVYNETLCPDLWDEYKHLDGRIRSNLLRLAYDFYEKTEFVAPIVDVYLMGSIANYNWTPESDVDIHILIDFTQLKMPEDTAKEVTKTASSKWNDEHEVIIKTHKVEINLQDTTQKKPYVTGIYSLVKDQWVRNPQRQDVAVDKMSIQAKFSAMKKYLEAIIRSGDREEMKKAKKYVDAFRQYGLDTRGELSTENIVFKILRARGIIKTLKDAIIATYDKEMTVPESINESLDPDYDVMEDFFEKKIQAHVRVSYGS